MATNDVTIPLFKSYPIQLKVKPKMFSKLEIIKIKVILMFIDKQKSNTENIK